MKETDTNMGGRNGGGCLTKLILLVMVTAVAIIGVIYFTSPQSPFFAAQNKVSAPAPVLVGTITREFKLITAQVTGQTTVESETKSALPFSSERYNYQLVITVTAGIDLTKMLDTDIKTEGEKVTLKLPAPEVLTKERKGWVVSRNQELFSGPTSDQNIIDKMSEVGEQKIMDGITKDGKLYREARLNAEIQLRNFILQLGYKEVKFEYADDPPKPTPNPSAPPR